MLNIPDEVKSLLHQESVRKTLQIVYPNRNDEKWSNAWIIAESLKLTESICSEEFLRFGLAENSVLEFETCGWGNRTGEIIKAYILISLASLTAEQIAAIQAETWDGDVQQYTDTGYVFRIPLGSYKVDQCPKDSSPRVRRKFKCYSIGSFDEPNIFEKTKLALPLFYEGYTYQPPALLLVFAQLANSNEKVLMDNGWSRRLLSRGEGTNSASYVGLNFKMKNTNGDTLEMYFNDYGIGSIAGGGLDDIIGGYYKKANIREWVSRFDAYLETLNIDLSEPVTVADSVDVYVNSIADLRNLLAKQTQIYNGTKYKSSGGPYNALFPYVEYRGRDQQQPASETVYSYNYLDIDEGDTDFIAFYQLGIRDQDGRTTFTYVNGGTRFPKSYKLVVNNLTTEESEIHTDSVDSVGYIYSYTPPADAPLLNKRLYFEPNGNKIGVSSYTGVYDQRQLINDFMEIFAEFAVPARDGSVKVIRLDPTVKEEYITSDFSDYSIQQPQGKSIGTLYFKFVNGEYETVVTYQFANGTGVYDLTGNTVLTNLGLTQEEIIDFLQAQFVPYVNVDPSGIEMECRGLPYVECGDYINVKRSETVESKAFITRREMNGIQVLRDGIETVSNADQAQAKRSAGSGGSGGGGGGGVTGWGSPSTITIPYTPTKDGMVVAAISPSTSSNSWVFISDNGSTYMRAMSSGGTGYGMSFPVIHGHEYTVGSSGNVGSAVYTFIPFG